MTGTTSVEATSGGKVCTQCQNPLGENEDKRFNMCSGCRLGENVLISPEAPPPAPAQEADFEPIHIDVEASRPPPVEHRSFYWCGATHDCPMDITLGGIEFPKTIGRLMPHGDGKLQLETDYRDGQIHELTDTHFELVKEHAGNRVVRKFRTETTTKLNGTTVTKYHGTLKSISGSRRTYTPDPDDKPVGQFVYMIRVKHRDDRPLQNPPTMVPRDW